MLSVERMTWLRATGLDRPPAPTAVNPSATDTRQLALLAARIEAVERQLATSDIYADQRRLERRLERLIAQRDAIEERQATIGHLADDAVACPACGYQLNPRTQVDYGLAHCPSCATTQEV